MNALHSAFILTSHSRRRFDLLLIILVIIKSFEVIITAMRSKWHILLFSIWYLFRSQSDTRKAQLIFLQVESVTSHLRFVNDIATLAFDAAAIKLYRKACESVTKAVKDVNPSPRIRIQGEEWMFNSPHFSYLDLRSCQWPAGQWDGVALGNPRVPKDAVL